MYCINCGNKLSDGASFCPECGAKQVDPIATNVAAPVNNRKNKGGKKLIFLLIGILAVLVIVVGLVKGIASKVARLGTKARKQNEITYGNGEVEVTFIDVEQGDCILITDAGRCMLIDTGNKDSYKAIEEYLHGKGINTVDVLVITHPDLDHIGSSILLLAEFDIPTIYIPDVEGKSRDYTGLMSATRQRNTEVINPVCGLPIEFGTADYTIFCTNNIEYDDINSYSLIVKAVNGEDSFLFTGDATGEEIDAILKDGYDLSADVMMAANHGSSEDGSNSESFVKAVNPRSFVISGGDGSEEVIKLANAVGLDVYKTNSQGKISFLSTKNGITANVEAITSQIEDTSYDNDEDAAVEEDTVVDDTAEE